MVLFQLFFAYEVDCCHIIREIVRHLFDFTFDFSQIRAFFCNYVAFTKMLVFSRQLRIFTLTYTFHCRFNRNGVLHAVLHAGNAANGIGMPLAYAFAPESIFFTFRQNSLCKQTIQREQARVPTCRNNTNIPAFNRRCVYFLEIFRYFRMCVKAIYCIKQCS
ncbi:hypothetical protein D3C74_406560 [compost metagenome]